MLRVRNPSAGIHGAPTFLVFPVVGRNLLLMLPAVFLTIPATAFPVAWLIAPIRGIPALACASLLHGGGCRSTLLAGTTDFRGRTIGDVVRGFDIRRPF